MSPDTQVASARLSRATLQAASSRPGVTSPALDPDSLTIGIVHFGLGAFHRAHQAIYTEDAAAAAEETHWGILGVTGRSDTVVRQLQPQDGLYGVLIREAHASSLRLVGSVRDVAWPGDRSGDVVETLAAPTTHIVTLTITEQGYPLARGGGLDMGVPGVAEDRQIVANELRRPDAVAASRTPLGLLTRGLARRFRAGGSPLSVVSCDNLASNGAVLRTLILALSDGLDDGFSAWLRSDVAFPSTMVDRITPATTAADRDEALALLGFEDQALVVAEPFAQWVIEDSFAGPRPPWELAGAIITHDVAPYETVKLRVLNTVHLLLAWTGLLCGHRTIAEAVADPRLRTIVHDAIDDDILPTLTAPQGIDLRSYCENVLERLANPALAHTTAQVGSGGSLKLPNRVVGTILDRLAAGAVPRQLAFMLAAWLVVIATSSEPGAHGLDDPAAEELRARVGSLTDLSRDPLAAVQRLLSFHEVFPEWISSHEGFAVAVANELPRVEALMAESRNP